MPVVTRSATMPDDLEGSARGHQQQSERRLRECSRIFTRAGRYGLNIHGASVRHTLDFISHTMQKPFLPLPLSHSKGVADSKPMRYGVWGENDRQWEATYKAAYTRIATRIQALHFKNGMRRHETTKFKGIPRIIHHIWLGPPCPTSMRRWMRKWHDMHPRWQHILWDEKSIDGFGLRNAAAYDAAENFGEKSDIARYEILERMGYVLQVSCDWKSNCDTMDFLNSLVLKCDMSAACDVCSLGDLTQRRLPRC